MCSLHASRYNKVAADRYLDGVRQLFEALTQPPRLGGARMLLLETLAAPTGAALWEDQEEAGQDASIARRAKAVAGLEGALLAMERAERGQLLAAVRLVVAAEDLQAQGPADSANGNAISYRELVLLGARASARATRQRESPPPDQPLLVNFIELVTTSHATSTRDGRSREEATRKWRSYAARQAAASVEGPE